MAAQQSGLWSDVLQLIHGFSHVLPSDIFYGYEFGDGFVAWNSIGPPADVFEVLPQGTAAWAEEGSPTNISSMEADKSPIWIHNQQFLRHNCGQSHTQIDHHILRHGRFMEARHVAHSDPVLGLSASKIDGCHIDLLVPTPHWVNGISYPKRDSKMQRKSLPVVWRGRTTGGGISRESDWREVRLYLSQISMIAP
jgi:hypothetical protein